MATVRVYGSFVKDYGTAYFYDGEWYGFLEDELMIDRAKRIGNGIEYFSYSSLSLEELGLDNPEFLVYFDVEVEEK